MRYQIINPSTEQQQAWQQLTWEESCARCEQLPNVFKANDSRLIELRQRVTLADQVVAMLGAMNDFDLQKVLLDIHALAKNPNPAGGVAYWRDSGIKMMCTSANRVRHHYVIDYVVVAGKVAIRQIYFNDSMLGQQPDTSKERTALYLVERDNGARYSKPTPRAEVDQLEGAWRLMNPTPQISTEYAAVNGMNNHLQKAVWLMGVHLDSAYRTANPDAYTLMHNPSRGSLGDLAECLWDKLPFERSEPAQHLSAVLRQRQAQGRPTHWVVHSQGAIIFHAAVSLHNQCHRTPLSQHRVAIHGSGAFLTKMRSTLSQASIGIVHVRNNPFDMVPNIAGRNNLKGSSLYRSLRFMGLVVGDNEGHIGVSPHTLPYLGIKNYQQQLQMAGETDEAKRVARYIDKRNVTRQQRRS